MSGRLLITSAFMLLFTVPASADCNQEIQGLNEMVTQAETGASSAGSELPATPHQEQVLAGGQTDQQAADLIAEAREMAEGGNEEGCMQKVTEAKSLLGID